MRVSRSLLRGFLTGLSGASLIARRLQVRRSSRFSASVGNSWRRVGRVLEKTLNAESGDHLEKAREKAGSKKYA